MWNDSGPLSDNWQIPKGSGHKFLIRYMIAEQVSTYGESILNTPPFNNTILIRNMKLLCKEFDEETLKRAIAWGCLKSEHPFSTKFVKECAKWLQGLRESPLQRFYQNKS